MKNKKIISFLFYFIFAFIFIIGTFTYTQTLIIKIVEKIFDRTLRDPARWMEILKHCFFILLFILGIFFSLNHLKQGKLLKKEISNTISKVLFFYKDKKTILYLIGISIFYFIVFFKIIDANFLYDDDIWRSYEGSRSWIGFSRYISEFFSMLIHTSVSLSDIAPLNYFITIIIMSFSTVLLMFVLNDGKLNILGLLALSVVFISPFFVQNFSYRFDCIYMALAVFFPIVPFVFKNENLKQYSFISIISIILCCMCYQAGTSVYIMITIFCALQDWSSKKDNKKIFSFILTSLISYIISLLIFKLFFMNTISNSTDDYFSTKISLSSFLPNLKNYISNLFILLGGKWIKFFFCLSTIISLIVQIRKTNRNKTLCIVVSIFAFILSVLLSFGPYIIFEKTLFSPRAFLGINVLFALTIFNCTRIEKKVFVIPALAMLYGCIVFIFAYGNTLAEQKKYQEFRTEILLSDLKDFTSENEMAYLSFSGSIGNSSGFKENQKNYPLLKKIITTIPTDVSIWNDDFINTYNYKCEDVFIKDKDDLPLLKSTYYHDIYGKDNHFYILLK